MMKDWDRLARDFSGTDLLVGYVDCTKHPKFCHHHGVHGYPSLKYYAKGNKTATPWHGDQTYEILKRLAYSLYTPWYVLLYERRPLTVQIGLSLVTIGVGYLAGQIFRLW